MGSSYDRLSYLGALLIPLAFLSLAAPLLAAGALPEVLINVLADWFPQYSIQFQYVAVIVPFLVAAAILGLARLRRARRPAAMARLLSHDGAVAVVWVGVVLVAGAVQSPMPWTNDIPAIGSDQRVEQYHVGHHARVLERAVAMIPDDVPVSAANLLGGPPLGAGAHLHLPGHRRRAVGDRRPPPPLRGGPARPDPLPALPRGSSAPAPTCAS